MEFGEYIRRQRVEVVGHRPPVSLPSSATVEEAIGIMQDRRVGCLLVIDDGSLAGIFTERDLLRKLLTADGKADLTVTLDRVMTAKPVSAYSDEPLFVLLGRMFSGGFRHMPLLDREDRVLGTISIKRVVRYLADQFPEAVYNLPPEPDVFGAAREGA